MSNAWLGQGGGYETRLAPSCSRCGGPMVLLSGEGCPVYVCRTCAERPAGEGSAAGLPSVRVNGELGHRTLKMIAVLVAVVGLGSSIFDLGSSIALAAPDPRCDVNGDGVIDAGDLLEVRKPGNWQQRVGPSPTASPTPTPTASPTPGPMYATVVRLPADPRIYTAPQHVGGSTLIAGGAATLRSSRIDDCLWDVRGSSVRLERLTLRSEQHGVMIDPSWRGRDVTIYSSAIEAVGYGVYAGCDGLRIVGSTIWGQQRDALRIVGGRDIVVEDCVFPAPRAAVATRVHGDASDIVFRGCTWYGGWPYGGVDLGEQYAGAGGCVRRVVFEDCVIVADARTRYGWRVRAQDVTLRRCRGVGFAAAVQGAALVQIERHSCDPTGVRIEGCTVDDGRPVVGARWADTVVRP